MSFFSNKSQFLNVLRVFSFSVALFCKFATLSDFEKIKKFGGKANLFSRKKPKFWTIGENILIQLHSTANLLPFAHFKKSHSFSSKIRIFLLNETRFWTFRGVLLFQWHYTAILLILTILKTFKIYFERPICFFSSRSHFLIVLRIVTNWVAFYIKFATFGDF